MVAKDGRLGMPTRPIRTEIVRNTAYVSGRWALSGACPTARPHDLPGNAFHDGRLRVRRLDDLAGPRRRRPQAGLQLLRRRHSDPRPTLPADGGALTLFAQWKAVDYGADDPALPGFLSIPSSLSLEPYGDRALSLSPRRTPPAGDHSVVVAAAPELPGATWPAGKTYRCR
ncbi:hypothetical protein [Eggerthella lenta]|uniref:hypothetical protein n=1 Tax=Eggerthella lenta TaxID=84112 RepID=UPI001F31937C|nr:hypothetical protein [Eggerthella lenta]